MNKEDLLKIYDDEYAENYDNRFLLEPGYKSAAEYELLILKQIIDENTNWLDVGCGTGHFLSKFEGVERSGLDLSPSMLKIAKKRNPDALFFKEGDFRNCFEEFNEKFSLVTSMWGAYVYLDSQKEIEKFIQNIINWTAVGGSLFLPVIDYEDFRPSIEIPYKEETFTKNNISYGQTIIKSFTWDYIEYIGKSHVNLVSLHLNYVIDLISPHFNSLEVIYYPLDKDEKVSRKAVIAKNKLKKIDANKNIDIVWTKPKYNLKRINSEPNNSNIAFSDIGLSFFLKRLRFLDLGFWKNFLKFLIR